MTNTEKLVFIDLAIKTVQEFIASTPDEDHYGDYEYLDLLRGLQLDELKGEHSLNESTSKQTMQELYEVLTEAHDKAMHHTLTSIYNENYIIPKEIEIDEILDFIDEVYGLDEVHTVH